MQTIHFLAAQAGQAKMETHLDVYYVTLAVLVPTVVILFWREYIGRALKRMRRRTTGIDGEKETQRDSSTSNRQKVDVDLGADRALLRRRFLQVYLLVMSSEWLQGPYIYALLRDTKGLEEAHVSFLFVAVFATAMVASPAAGFLADRFGRRNACLAFCALHTLASLSVLAGPGDLALLFAGRVLAGVGLALLWTVFESWMVTEFERLGGEAGGHDGLSAMFGLMTTSNCMTAIVSGLVGHCIVSTRGSTVDPFIFGVFLDVVAAVLMLRNWKENYGRNLSSHSGMASFVDSPTFASLPNRLGLGPEKLKSKITQPGDRRVWALTLISCSFEGSSFLMNYFWPGILQEAHARGHKNDDPPLGIIFASFMGAMILGAMLFGRLVGRASSSPKQQQLWWLRPHRLLGLATSGAGLTLLAQVLAPPGPEWVPFAAFLLFEACNGFYMPSMAYQKGLIVGEANRAGMYGLMRLPLFGFVVAALVTRVESPLHRQSVFLVCFVALMATSLLGLFWLGSRSLLMEEDEGEGVEGNAVLMHVQGYGPSAAPEFCETKTAAARSREGEKMVDEESGFGSCSERLSFLVGVGVVHDEGR